MDRRDFVLRTASTLAGGGTLARLRPATLCAADLSLAIAPIELELAPGKKVRTIAYNGQVPGPLLRVREGQRVTVDVTNATSDPETVHWHGLRVGADVDGAVEEGTPPIVPGETRSISFVAAPAGTRWYHTHGYAGRNLSRSTYTGQFAFLVIDPAGEPGAFDQECFLALHDWDPWIAGSDDGFESVRYGYASINGRLLGAADPIRVRQGERMLLRVLNASASEMHELALPGHRFSVVALDGNPAPVRASVNRLIVWPGERVDAVVEMNNPGIWILGEARDEVRDAGMGVVVEYAARSGKPQWQRPESSDWSYSRFAAGGAVSTPPSTPIPLVFRSAFHGHGAFEGWTINGKSHPDTDVIPLVAGTRYRLIFRNDSTEDHPLHLHRHSMTLVSVAGAPVPGIVKDVVAVPAHGTVEADFIADNPGRTLLHCHLQDHMDYGFMTLLDYR